MDVERDPAAYDSHYETTETLEVSFDEPDVDMNLNVWGNNARFDIKFLNMSYQSELHKLDVEIGCKERLDGGEGKFEEGVVRMEVIGDSGLIDSRMIDIGESGEPHYSIKEGFGFIPYVKFESPVSVYQINRVDVYMDMKG